MAQAELNTRRIGAWLLVATIALILYGSLFPFRFLDEPPPLSSILAELEFHRPGRGDLVANVLLYAPLGFCIAITLAGPRRHILAFLVAIVGGVSLSLGTEFAQALSLWRVTSLTDVVLNAIGTAAGATAGVLFAHRLASWQFRKLTPHGPALGALVVLLAWLGVRLAPFLPTIDWQKYKDALKPVLVNPEISARSVLPYVVGWLIVAYALRATWPAIALRLWLLTAAAVLAGGVVIVAKTVSPNEVAGLALCVPLILAGRRLSDRAAAAWLAAAAIVVVLVQGLEPYRFSATQNDFSWIPLRSSIVGRLELGYTVLFEKTFWYGSALWLAARAGMRLMIAALACALIVGAIEVAQMHLPRRTPEITDPLLVLGLAWLFQLLATRSLAPSVHVGDRFPQTIMEDQQ